MVIVDPAAGTVVGTLAVGKRPRGIRVLSDGQTLLIALSGSPIAGPGVDESKLPPADRKADGIGVVDLRAMKVSRIMSSGPDPETFAMSPDEKTVYLSNEDTGEMSMVDVASGEVRVHVPRRRGARGRCRPPGREGRLRHLRRGRRGHRRRHDVAQGGRTCQNRRASARRHLHTGRRPGLRHLRERRRRHRRGCAEAQAVRDDYDPAG
jgi:hypothetical protein